ncbi:glycoside hydrolase [Phlyctema vagabunda]|uniref:Glycoside hydrolase n=1 Tax=Phlyctema vagabunda TaxID=108571 RepID=A0ABR4P681_9HELO
MRSNINTAAFLASSLLATTIVAGPAHPVKHRHRKDLVYVTDTAEVVETVWNTVYVTVGPEDEATEAPPAATEPVIEYTTVTNVATVPTSSAAPAPVVTVQQEEVSEPTTSVTPTTLATVAKSSSSSAVKATSTASTKKRGLAYNDASLLSSFSGSSEVTWAYNWASSSSGLDLTGVEFIPLLWGNKAEFTDVWSEAATSAIASGSTALMSFNEPDLAEQSNIAYTDAAALYKTYMEPFAGKADLLAPSVTNGGSPMGLTYLKNFIGACSGCTIDAINIHWYDSASNIDYFKNYVAEAYEAGGNRPVWISEFGASGSDAEQNTFLETVLPWLDEQDYVVRYAYFMAKDGVLLSGKTLSTLGTTFSSYTS